MAQKYYCKRCEQFFHLGTYSPKVCPNCFTGAKDILGPYEVHTYDI